jgi:hypothetical protein
VGLFTITDNLSTVLLLPVSFRERMSRWNGCLTSPNTIKKIGKFHSFTRLLRPLADELRTESFDLYVSKALFLCNNDSAPTVYRTQTNVEF